MHKLKEYYPSGSDTTEGMNVPAVGGTCWSGAEGRRPDDSLVGDRGTVPCPEGLHLRHVSGDPGISRARNRGMREQWHERENATGNCGGLGADPGDLAVSFHHFTVEWGERVIGVGHDQCIGKGITNHRGQGGYGGELRCVIGRVPYLSGHAKVLVPLRVEQDGILNIVVVEKDSVERIG